MFMWHLWDLTFPKYISTLRQVAQLAFRSSILATLGNGGPKINQKVWKTNEAQNQSKSMETNEEQLPAGPPPAAVPLPPWSSFFIGCPGFLIDS